MEIFVSSSFEKIKLTKIDSNLKSIHMHVLNLKSVSIQKFDWLIDWIVFYAVSAIFQC